MGLIINYTYDTSVTDLNTVGNAAYNPTIYSGFTSAARAAIHYFETMIITPITVNISFGWGEVAGSPLSGGSTGQSSSLYNTYNYSQLRTAVLATDTKSAVQIAASATLPVTDPAGGALFDVTTAEQKALGLLGANPGLDGGVGLNSATAFSWSQNSIAANTDDATGVLEHEISEVLGRSATGGSGNHYTLLDMFRYRAIDGGSADAAGTAVGVRDEPFVTGYDPNAGSYFSYNGATITNPFETPANVASGADVADWNASVPNDAFADGFSGTPTPVTATDLQVMNVLGYDLACFLPDTRIATPSGEVPVQSLRMGDLVRTQRGDAKCITWIGQGKALATRGQRSAATPVIVRKCALADNVPNQDLRITKGHSLYIGGVLIPVEFLINHRSIIWDDRAQEVEVYHIELAEHDVLLANGAAAESYRDDGNRWLFRNNNENWQQSVKPPFAPVLTGGPVVDAIWRRLLTRSGQRPGLPLTDDPDLHLMVNGSRIDGEVGNDCVYRFRLPPPVTDVRVVSRAGAQDELGLARDPRVLGVGVRRIVLWRGRRVISIEADDSCLSNGFHGYEADNGLRWTNGEAVLPMSLFLSEDSGVVLEIYVAGTTRYPLLDERGTIAA